MADFPLPSQTSPMRPGAAPNFSRAMEPAAHHKGRHAAVDAGRSWRWQAEGTAAQVAAVQEVQLGLVFCSGVGVGPALVGGGRGAKQQILAVKRGFSH